MEWLIWVMTLFGLIGIPVIIAGSIQYQGVYYMSIVVNSIVCFIITQQNLEMLVAIFYHFFGSDTITSFRHEKITVILAAYLPNEKDIIFETLSSYKNMDYEGPPGKNFNVILAYNTPKDIPDAEKAISDYQKQNSSWFSFYKVPNSRSKAQNINYVLDNATTHKIIGVFDADHHPYPDNLYRGNYWITERGYDFVQGRCKVRPGSSILSNLVSLNFDLMYCIQHQFRKAVFDYGIFGGSNGYWRADLLRLLQFDHHMLTEDIDCTVRAIRNGRRGMYDNKMVSTELAPPSMDSLIQQRVRWAQGWMEVSIAHFSTYFTAPNYKWYQRLAMVNLFVIRELLSHTTLLCLPLMIAKMIWESGALPDPFAGFVLIYSLTSYPLMVVAGFISSYEIYKDNFYLIPISFLFSIGWIYIEQFIMMRARSRWALKQNNWVVTRRN